jgi:hypothetical protein
MARRMFSGDLCAAARRLTNGYRPIVSIALSAPGFVAIIAFATTELVRPAYTITGTVDVTVAAINVPISVGVFLLPQTSTKLLAPDWG